MTDTTTHEDEWVIECADPEVGIFSDSIVHECDENFSQSDPQDATADVTMRTSATDPRMVDVTTTFTCPACTATYVIVEQNPIEWFA
jgi:hypothetical protein